MIVMVGYPPYPKLTLSVSSCQIWYPTPDNQAPKLCFVGHALLPRSTYPSVLKPSYPTRVIYR